MVPGTQDVQVYRFGPFELDTHTAELRKFGVRIKLQDQPRQILLLLLECGGEIVSREQIRKQLWPENTFVDFDNAINSAVRKLREALGDTADSPRYIETLARRGYRFVAPLAREAVPSLPEKEIDVLPPREPAAAGSARRSKWKFAGLAAAFALTIGLAVLVSRTVDMSGTKHLAEMQVTPLTSNPGLELHPSFSPDTTRVAYAWTAPGQQPAIYVKLNGPGDPVRMSKDLPRVFSPAWSPDGRWIAAMQDLGEAGAILLIPAAGGQSRLLARVIKAKPSADACAVGDFPFICGVATSGSVLAWSSDGKYLFTSAEPTRTCRRRLSVFRSRRANCNL
jgi:DNA-binding winged helix-turn-helix (wHTH) protein